MLLCCDIGNTNIKFGGFTGGELTFFTAIATDPALTYAQYACQIKDLFALFGVPESFDGSAISSVCPAVTEPVMKAIETVCGVTPLLVAPGLKTGLNIRAANAAEVATDVACAAVCAINEYALPCLVVTLGTATTMFVVNEAKEFLGGVIIPGVITSAQALSESAAKLPHISLEPPDGAVLLTDTVKAMNAGIVYGTASMIDGLADMFARHIDIKSMILCGGLNQFFLPYLRHKFTPDDYIVLKGLKKIFELNQPRY